MLGFPLEAWRTSIVWTGYAVVFCCICFAVYVFLTLHLFSICSVFAGNVFILGFCSTFFICIMFRLACEVVRMRVSNSKSEAVVLCRKKVDCPLQVGKELLPRAREDKYLEVLVMSEGRKGAWDGSAVWYGICSDVDAVLGCCGEEGAEPEGKAFNLLVHLRPNPHLWSWALGNDCKNEVTDTSSRNELPQRGGWAQP